MGSDFPNAIDFEKKLLECLDWNTFLPEYFFTYGSYDNRIVPVVGYS